MGRGGSSLGGGSRGHSSIGRGRSGGGGPRRGGLHRSVLRTVGGITFYSRVSSGEGNPRGSLIFMAIVFLFFGLSALFGGTMTVVNNSNYASVEAVAISNEYIAGYYYTTYGYIIDEVEYVSQSDEGWEKPETVGATVTIYYLKSDPKQITESYLGVSIEPILMFFGAGSVFTGVGVLLIISAKKAKTQEEVVAEGGAENSNTKLDADFVKCAYCDSIYSKGLPSCPRCGAGRRE